MFQTLQVWYHVCANRGRGCYNTRLKEDSGCTIWYNEKEVKINACMCHPGRNTTLGFGGVSQCIILYCYCLTIGGSKVCFFLFH